MSEENNGTNYILLGVIVLLSVGLAMGGSYFMLMKFGGINNDQPKQEEKTAKKLGPTSKLSQFLVNLADGRQYVKVNIVFELSSEEVIKEIKNRKPQIRDNIISILRTKTYKEITSKKGTRNLRTEIMKQINKFLLKGKVTNVFFTEFVVQ
ncbi:flagellar basal body-associated FliL family protein [Halanaerocella petrolearia]